MGCLRATNLNESAKQGSKRMLLTGSSRFEHLTLKSQFTVKQSFVRLVCEDAAAKCTQSSYFQHILDLAHFNMENILLSSRAALQANRQFVDFWPTCAFGKGRWGDPSLEITCFLLYNEWNMENGALRLSLPALTAGILGGPFLQPRWLKHENPLAYWLLSAAKGGLRGKRRKFILAAATGEWLDEALAGRIQIASFSHRQGFH